jgi:transposase
VPKLQQKLSSSQIQELEAKLQESKNCSEIKRIQSILLIDKDTDLSIIKQLTNLQRSQVFDLRKRYLTQGLSSIAARPRKYQRLLTKGQLTELEETLRTSNPSLLGYHTDYWTTAILDDYIEGKYEVKYKSKTSVQLIFKQVKFSFHKPEGVYKKHDPELVEQWKQTNQQIIQKAWEDENTIILCEDEAIIRSTTTFQKVWLPIGEYPQVSVSNLNRIFLCTAF